MTSNGRGFASRLGFILSMAAFSIGIGNLWKFPYVVGNNGGGAFLLVYIILVFLIGIPAFLIEVTLGRSAQLAPIKGMEKLEGKKTPFSAIGWLASLAIFVINSFAIMIVGRWAGGYIIKTFSGSMNGLSAEQIAAEFAGYSGSMQSVLISIVEIVLLWLCLCVRQLFQTGRGPALLAGNYCTAGYLHRHSGRSFNCTGPLCFWDRADSRASLIFVTLPNLFNQMGGLGQIFGGLFMICVYFAGFTSLLGDSEALVANITEVSGCSRHKAATGVSLAQFLFSIVFLLSFGEGPAAKFQALGLGFFDFADFIAEGVFLTIGAILMVAYVVFNGGSGNSRRRPTAAQRQKSVFTAG